MKTRWLLPFLIGSLAWATPEGKIPLSEMTEVKTSVYNENDLQAVLLVSQEGKKVLILRDSHGRSIPSSVKEVYEGDAINSIRWLNGSFLALTGYENGKSEYSVYYVTKNGDQATVLTSYARGNSSEKATFKVRRNQLRIDFESYQTVVNVRPPVLRLAWQPQACSQSVPSLPASYQLPCSPYNQKGWKIILQKIENTNHPDAYDLTVEDRSGQSICTPFRYHPTTDLDLELTQRIDWIDNSLFVCYVKALRWASYSIFLVSTPEKGKPTLELKGHGDTLFPAMMSVANNRFTAKNWLMDIFLTPKNRVEKTSTR